MIIWFNYIFSLDLSNASSVLFVNSSEA